MAEPAGGKKPSPVKDAQGKEIPVNKLIDSLVKDPGNPPQLIMLSGFIGRSNRDNYVRIYADLDLRHYCDVLGTDVVYTPEGDPARPMTAGPIFVKAGARVVWTQSADASFIEGPITSAHPIRSARPQGVPTGHSPLWGDGGISPTCGCLSLDHARCTFCCVLEKRDHVTGSHYP